MNSECPQCHEIWPVCSCPSWSLKYIIFARPQIFWLLHNKFTFEGEAGYTDEKVHKSRTAGAVFESVSCIVAEIEARVSACGEAGEALTDEAPQVETMNQLSRPAMRALNYSSGWRRRRLSYAEWKRREKSQNPTSENAMAR